MKKNNKIGIVKYTDHASLNRIELGAKNCLAELSEKYGIEFDYKFRDFHDRQITTDDGWSINLGRGLDIYDKYNAYSVASGRQDKRKCREFRVIYMRNENNRNNDE